MITIKSEDVQCPAVGRSAGSTNGEGCNPGMQTSLSYSAAAGDGQGGLSFVELLIVLVIMGILTSIAVVGLRSLGPTSSLNRATSELRVNMEHAKMIAVQESTPCLVEFNPGGSPGSYKACLDEDDDQNCDSEEEVVLQQSFAHYSGIRLQSAGFTNGEKIRFNTLGEAGSISGFSMGTVNCTNKLGEIRSVVLSSTGRIEVR